MRALFLGGVALAALFVSACGSDATPFNATGGVVLTGAGGSGGGSGSGKRNLIVYRS